MGLGYSVGLVVDGGIGDGADISDGIIFGIDDKYNIGTSY